MKIINLISGPRNLSTALMYSFGQRDDTRVWDEPFYAVYLNKSGASHPGRDEVLRAQPADEAIVKHHLATQNDRPVVFVKNMAHHMEAMREPFIKGALNVFLIRHPAQILASYAEVIVQPVMRDIGIAYQYQLFTELRKKDEDPAIVDAGELLRNPCGVLEKLCHHCAIGFSPAMLSWPPGPKPFDGVWAKYWYKNVHQSVGFAEQKTSNRPLPAHLQELCANANHYYEKLLPFSLKA